MLLGTWLGGIAFAAAISAYNSRSAERLLAQPAPSALEHLNTVGRGSAQELLRYHASEQNRWYRESWGSVQIALGVAVLFILLFGTHEGKFPLLVAIVMLTIALAERFALTPVIAAQGRLLDFMPPGTGDAERARLLVMMSGYYGLELANAATGVVLGGLLLRNPRRRSGDSRFQVDAVDEADYRHVNR